MLTKFTTHQLFRRLITDGSSAPKIQAAFYSTERLMNAKERKNMSFLEIANHIGRSESWTAGLFYGKYQPNSVELQKLTELLSLPAQDRKSAVDERFSGPNFQLFPVIEEIHSFPVCDDQKISVRGWIKTIRRQKKVTFVELIDGSTSRHLQVVIAPKDSEGLETGCAIQVTGILVKSLGDQQPNELKAHQVNLVGACAASEYPLQKKSSPSSAFLRRIPHLRLRTPQMAALMRIRSAMAHEASLFLHQHHFFRTETPVITFNDCEGAGEVFSVKPEEQTNADSDPPANQSSELLASNPVDQHQEFFGREAFLTVSGQLHLEALAASLGRVYTIGPAFRAERSQTNRHLAEFWMLEAEMSFVEGLDSLMDLVEGLIKSIITSLHRPDSSSAVDLKLLDCPQQPQTCLETNWQRITYGRAIELIQSHNQTSPSAQTDDDRLPALSWGQPLASEHERWLAGTYAQGPLFVTDYPSSLKPFYMSRNPRPKNDGDSIKTSDSSHQTPATQSTVACFDLLVPGIGELIGGSLRESDFNSLAENMIARGLLDETSPTASSSAEVEDSTSRKSHRFDWYLDLRRFGSPSSAGFGVGWERLLAWLTGIQNVRECVAFPRASGSGHC